MTDRFDDLLIKARAEMLGKHTLRPEPQTDVVFDYVWDQMQKGFKDGLKQGYADNRNKKEGGSDTSESRQATMQSRGESAKAKVEARRAKAKERRQNKKTQSMAEAREHSERMQNLPDLTQEMAEANPPTPKGPTGPPPSKQPSKIDMDDIRARVDALRNPTPTETPSAAEAGFAAMGQSGDAGVQAPPSQPPAPAPAPAPAQPPANPYAALGVGAHNPVDRNQNVSNPNADAWGEVRQGRLADLQPLNQANPSQQALANNPVAPSQMDVGDAMNVLDNSGAQAPPTMSQPQGQPAPAKQTDDGSLSDANAVLDGKVNYSSPRSAGGGKRVPVSNQAGKGFEGQQSMGTPQWKPPLRDPSKEGVIPGKRYQEQSKGPAYTPQTPQPPPSGLETAMTQNPQNPDATVAAANKRQMERNDRRQPQTNLFDFKRSVVKDPFANPFHNPHAFDVHDNFGMEKMNPRLPKEGAIDGVLSRNPDPPAMNAGMPRMKDMDAYYSEQENAREESKRHFDFIEQLTAMGVDPETLDRASMADIKQLMMSEKDNYGKPSKMPGPSMLDEPPSADEYAKSFENANMSLLPASMLKKMKGQQQASADYSLLPQGWREEVV